MDFGLLVPFDVARHLETFDVYFYCVGRPAESLLVQL